VNDPRIPSSVSGLNSSAFIGLRHIAAALACLVGFTLFASPNLFAQSMAAHDMSAMKEIPPPDKLPVPLPMTGIGNSHLTITATPEAQAWFNQGLNLLHDFWDYESARAFEQGVRVDPNCAMCYWGLYQTLNFRQSLSDGYSKAALASAVRLESKITPKERLYIQAAVAEQAEQDDTSSDRHSSADSKATSIWRQIVKLDPNDLQARIFLAGSLRDGYDDSGEPKAGTKQEIAVLEEVLKRAPDDSAANHYWIHAMEPSNHPERALVSAQHLASLAPASGHMVHMPGHIFYRVGDYAEAEHWFTASTAVDEAYMRSQHVDVDDDWNYVHNLMYTIANYMEEGKLQQATILSGKLAGARGQFSETLYIGSPRDDMTRLNTLLPVALRTGDWRHVQSLLASSQPDAKLENLLFLSGQLREFATGMLDVESNDVAAAQTASNALDADLWRRSQKVKDTPKPDKSNKPKSIPTAPVMAAVMPDAEPAPLLSSLSIMSLELRASILAAQKKLPEANALFAEAAHEEKALGYREPPMYIRPVGETEGAALLHADDPQGAHQAYAAALAERPNSGFGLYGLARSSEAGGNAQAARAEYAKFLEAWKDSDPANPELAHAHDFLATLHGDVKTTAGLH
jgi:tetratricopeptide (TPR) repeat protein